MGLCYGTAAGAKDIAGQRAILPAWRDSKRMGDCPLGWASAPGDRGFRFRRSGFPIMEAYNRRTQSGLLLGLTHRFWTILGGILTGFIVLEHLFQSFYFGHPVQAELLEIPSQRVH